MCQSFSELFPRFWVLSRTADSIGQSSSGGTQNLVAMASNLRAMASNVVEPALCMVFHCSFNQLVRAPACFPATGEISRCSRGRPRVGRAKIEKFQVLILGGSHWLLAASSNALVTSSDAFVTSSF